MIYIDTLISFMPDSTLDSEGNLIPSESLSAGRDAMIELSGYQKFRDLKSLYSAINYACKYAGVDMINTIVKSLETTTEDLCTDLSGDDCLYAATLELFKSVRPEVKFDIIKFITYILKVIHEDITRTYENHENVTQETE